MSLSTRKAARSAAIAIMIISVLVGGIYYLVPNNPRIRSVAFALGPFSAENSMNPSYSEVFSLEPFLNATLENGSELRYEPMVFSGSGQGFNPHGELNSTDISNIIFFPVPDYGGGIGINLPPPYLLTFEYAMDWGVNPSLNGDKVEDLGALNVANYTFSYYDTMDEPIPTTPAPKLNYTLQVNATGNWNVGPLLYGPWWWQMNSAQIERTLFNATNPTSITINLDLSINLYYLLTTNDGTQSGSTRVQWAGLWGVIQPLRQGDELVGLQCDFADVKLVMVTN